MFCTLRRTSVVVVAAMLALGLPQTASAAPALSAAPAVSAPGDLNDPGGDAFYTPPSPIPASRPGDLVRVRQITTTQWLIMYRSTNALGEPNVVTGTVLLPPRSTKDPATLPIVGYAPGTQGQAFRCAASKTIQSRTNYEISGINDVLNQGFAIVVTDYEGYYQGGTPTYATGPAEGPAVLDAVRAAQRLVPAGLSTANPVVLQGYSQGGGAAAWAGEMQPTYAPEIKLVGIAAGGIPADLSTFGTFLDGTLFFGFVAFAGLGLQAAYPELDLDPYLTDAGRTVFAQAATYCAPDAFRLAGRKLADLTTSNPLETPAWKARIAESTLGFSPPKVPFFQYHGALDEIAPFTQAKKLYATYCAAGVQATFKPYELAEHIGTLIVGKNDVQRFTADRIAGRPVTTTCP